MEVTLSRKTLLWSITILVLVAGAWIASVPWRNGLFTQWMARSNAPSTSEPAFSAVNSMFAPNTSSEGAWEQQVCAGMTPDGCKLFEDLYGPAIWGMVSTGKLPKTTFTYAGVAQEVSRTDQVWKLHTSNAAQPWLYVEVSQDSTAHPWLLLRILFDQEAQARYGGR
ncbi:MAG TPA: hypothetical protein VLX61_01145 [Anaerolineales bacterium]|nr:hypothetical protein [Anaerolineales bacterium]